MSDRLRIEFVSLDCGGFGWTEAVLYADGRMFYLGQDAKFVERVLGESYPLFMQGVFDDMKHGASPEDAFLTAVLVSLDLDEEDFIESLADVEPWGLAP